MTSTARTPNWDEGLSARSTVTGKNEYVKSTAGAVNVTGNVVVTGNSVGLFTTPYDEIDATYPNGTTEVYTSKLAGVTQQTVTITYTTTAKDFILTVVRT